MGSDICTKNNHISRFAPDLWNTISYIMTNLQYITYEKQISMYKNVTTNICAEI